jgi:hypothetical protein
MFDFMIEQVIKINRAIQQPFSNVIIVGIEGLGKLALSRISLHTCRYLRHELSMTSDFSKDAWVNSLRVMIKSAVLDRQVNVFNL